MAGISKGEQTTREIIAERNPLLAPLLNPKPKAKKPSNAQALARQFGDMAEGKLSPESLAKIPSYTEDQIPMIQEALADYPQLASQIPELLRKYGKLQGAPRDTASILYPGK